MENQIKTLSGPSWRGVRYFTTQVSGGVSQGNWAGLNLGMHCGDELVHVKQNRQLLNQLLPSKPHWLQQTHSTQLYQALKPATKMHTYEQCPIADAAWTQVPNTVIAILTADCLPVVIADTEGIIIGVAHAGWRGLANGILEKIFLRMQKQVAKDTQWQVWIGPAISQLHFEVGQDVFDFFVNKDPSYGAYFTSISSSNKYLADLPSLAAYKLKKIAQKRISIQLSQECTFAKNQNYYSYRRQGVTGRMVTVAWLA